MWLRFMNTGWFVALYFFLLSGSVVAGYAIARKRYVQRSKEWKPSGIETPVVGFFALLVSFTLSAAYGAAKDRNAFVHAQGDAIAELHREAFLLPDSLQSDVRLYLVRHIDVQLVYSRSESPAVDSLARAITFQNETFLQTMLKDSVRSAAFTKIRPAFANLSSSTFKMLYSFEERTPMAVMLLLLSASLLIGLLAGFMNGFHQTVHLLVPALYIVLTFFTLKAILDLDNPLHGNMRPKYQNLTDLKEILLPRN